MESTHIKEDELPSNLLKDKLIGKINMNEIESSLKKGDGNYSVTEELLKNFDVNLYTNYHNINKIDDVEYSQKYKSFRDINFYLDLVIALIKETKLNKNNTDSLLEIIKIFWNGRIDRFNRNNCKREEVDNYSIPKRCILKQIYDYHEDKLYLQKKSISNINENHQYKTYNKEKWSKILEHTERNEELYFSIDCKNTKKTGKYKDFLLSPTDICLEYDSINLDNITVTNKNMSTNEDETMGLKHLTQDAQAFTSTLQEAPDMPTESNSPSFQFREIFMPSGLTFTPLGHLLKNYINGKNRIMKHIAEDYTQGLSENSENEGHYISYNSVSH
ncbi:hypothetical protein POVCU2_0073300 [Plasmodium ovale curtisi]|uniref:PIR Superfamily Protein n=2 Tax=Plasmodium ovale curtisi TaxID=864141 RepID=A0A1A8WH54_PLAOA|nr:hypothetical protein POVCU2_0073300 [Plasmodium ovale curtisi]